MQCNPLDGEVVGVVCLADRELTVTVNLRLFESAALIGRQPTDFEKKTNGFILLGPSSSKTESRTLPTLLGPARCLHPNSNETL